MISKNYTYAFLAGLAAGAVASALYAPQSGAATRKRIRLSIEDAGANLSGAGKYLRHQADRLSTEAQASIAHTQNQVQQVLDQAGTALNATLKQTSETFATNAGLASDAIKTAISTAIGHSD